MPTVETIKASEYSAGCEQQLLDFAIAICLQIPLIECSEETDQRRKRDIIQLIGFGSYELFRAHRRGVND